MIKRGALIEFADHITDSEARYALKTIAHVLKEPYRSDFGLSVAEIAERPEPSVGDLVREYDDEWGGPVWYIP